MRLVWIGSAVALAGCGGIADRAAGTATRDTPVSPSTPDAGSGGEAGASGSPALALPRAVYTGSETSFALFSDGRLASWGRNGSGELGHPGGELFSIRDPGFEPVSVAADSHTCFLDARGIIRCAGYNYYFQLGDGTQLSRFEPTEVTAVSEPALVVAVGANQTCAYLTPSALRCWGNGVSDVNLRTLSEGTEYVDLAAGGNHVCAARAGNTISCWGSYTMWQGGSKYVEARAQDIAGVDDVVQVVAGFSHSCARTVEGRVWCWGDNSNGQLGFPATPGGCGSACEAPPQLVELPPRTQVSKVAARDNATLVVTSDAHLFGWGGLEHDGSCKNHPICASAPRKLVDFDDVVDAGLGDGHICVLRRDGSVWCWGDNGYNQVSDRPMGFIEDPVRVIPP